MQTQALQELIAFCEERKLGDIATGLKQELKTIRKSSSATLKPLAKSGSGQQTKVSGGGKNSQASARNEKGDQKRILHIIQSSLRKEEKKKNQEEVKKTVKKHGSNHYVPAAKRPPVEDQNFNKEENEEIMEGLMNKIVVNPNFINDQRLNTKVEGILGMEAFQKMVDNADVF